MHSQCVVAVYSSRSDAEQAYRAVLSSGIPQDHVQLSQEQQAQTTSETTGSSEGSFWDWLFGSDVPENDRRVYSERMAGGGTVLSVLVDSPSIANVDQVEGLLERYNPVEIHDEDAGSTTGTGRGASSTSSLNTQRATATAPSSSTAGKTEQVIPLPEEELKVGKRATERVQRIRTYVVEEPVQRDVKLRDERTVVERRPATGAAQGMTGERAVEIREVHEEPVVQKQVRAGEELVVRKEATERTERVNDIVKKTKADIDQQRNG
jgi:stress response protein YsnF